MTKIHQALKGIVLLATLLFSSAAIAQEACVEIDTDLTAPRAQLYAPLIATAAEGSTAEKVAFIFFAESGSWSVVSAYTPASEQGYFFFETASGAPQFKDVWGGVAEVSEQPELVKWAETLGAPADLAACFAETAATD